MVLDKYLEKYEYQIKVISFTTHPKIQIELMSIFSIMKFITKTNNFK